ncbi:Stress-induced morphogen (activity unknown) [Monaibacterium marinum]|uniref:Transcriptional regulator, BolA protein family n=1 Tax=Pontivivens marinum TaxID=1690039 RepID=A0A2C9CTD7_9RHOB|nr:BolA family transcriptional regulator [Monaibacterium marinum]SOH94522.1 Stress-induced morphogen (activity unknown) [Monaibacterium marinum]
MAMQASEIEALIREGFPGSEVKIDDLAGDGNHYAATVVAEQFRGLSRVKQHQAVYAALKGKMDGSHGELHALALTTKVPE